MIYVKIQGGLGNQLYQMFFGYELASILKREVVFDYTRIAGGWEDKDKEEKLQSRYRPLALSLYGSIDNQFKTFSRLNWEKDENFHFFIEPRIVDTENYIDFWKNIKNLIEDLKSVDGDKPIYVDGHWQSYPFEDRHLEYFKKYLDQIEAPDSQIKYAIETAKISCCINVRRGDYLTHYKGFFHECKMDYFRSAMDKLDSIYKNTDIQYFVFSDDIEWCKENFRGENITIVDHEFAGEKFTHYLDLMRRCTHYIIPNSTFAIWSAITTKSKMPMVFAPNKWYENRDEIPNPLRNSIAKNVTKEWFIVD
jgi:hypothetical protein